MCSSCQHVGIDIRRKNTNILGSEIANLVVQYHRDGVWLLAARTAGRPNTQTLPRLPGSGLSKWSSDVAAEMIEVVRLTKELGVIG